MHPLHGARARTPCAAPSTSQQQPPVLRTAGCGAARSEVESTRRRGGRGGFSRPRSLLLFSSSSATVGAATGAEGGAAAPRAINNSSSSHHRRPTACASATPGSGDGGGSDAIGGGGGATGGGRGKRLRGGRAREPGLFEIKDVSPPPRSLGVYALPPNTHTQDVIELCVDPTSALAAAEDPQAAAGAGSSSGSGGSSGSDDEAPADDNAVRRYIVTALVLQFKLVAGRYRRDHSRLEVQPVGRYLTNMALESAFRAKPYKKGEGGGGDHKGGDKGGRRQ